MKLRVIKFLKDFLLYTGLLRIFSPLNNLFFFIYNFNRLRQWIGKNREGLLLNDFYSWRRNHEKRYTLYETVSAHYGLSAKPVIYLEFGVAEGASFRWWTKHNSSQASAFFGFDTFEGLPENWGSFFKKGDMSAGIPLLNDNRVVFIKGIFQDTLNGFIHEHAAALRQNVKIIHMDADLFSASIFALSQLYQYLQKGDIILFDEFNVANHEFYAFKIFTDTFYIKLRPVAAVNNYYQMAFVVE